MKYTISILAHEKPEVVRDQVANFQTFLPGCAIILHLHVNFDWQGSRQDFSDLPGVYVNPVSLPTAWGNLHHAHHANFHFAKQQFDFEYFLLHSSSDLFVRPGADSFISTSDAGVSFVAPQPSWAAPLFAEGDPVFQRIMRDAGATELWCSQVEGTFYKKDAFDEMVRIIERHFDFRKTLPYVHEEIYYPTIAMGLGLKCSHPYLLREDKQNLPQFDADLVNLIRTGNMDDHHICRWKLGRSVDSLVWQGKNIYAIRPVPRVLEHPLRTYIRDLEIAA